MTGSPAVGSAAHDDLRRRLTEAEETLAAIRGGEVDAVVVDGPHAKQVYVLEGSDRPFRVFVDQMQEGALTITAASTILYCNRYFAELVGCPLEEVIGASFDTFLSPAFAPAFRAMLAGERDTWSQGDGLLLRAGSEVPVRLALNRLPPRDPPTFGMVVTDLTEQRRAQRLEAIRHAAEAANAARDRFLATLSHELRTPLNAVLGWSQLLGREPSLPEMARHGLDVIERNARAQSRLIEELLDISRVISGKLRIEPRPIDLAEIVRACAASVEPSAAAAGIELATLAAEAIPATGDPDRLQQVLVNLLANAIQNSPRGGRIELTLRRSGAWAEIQVRDNGRGISAEFLPRMFDPFEQGDTDPGSRGGGLGLGLALVKQLTEMHGGEVQVHSEGEGRGATFTVRLPRVSTPTSSNDAERSAPRP